MCIQAQSWSHETARRMRSGNQPMMQADGGGRFLLAAIVVMVLVVAGAGTIAAIVWPGLGDTRQMAQEAALKSNLHAMRDAIDQYYADKDNYPPSLVALVKEGYLHSIPRDPFTKSTETWVEVQAKIDSGSLETGSGEDSKVSIKDVRSGSERASRAGTPLVEW